MWKFRFLVFSKSYNKKYTFIVIVKITQSNSVHVFTENTIVLIDLGNIIYHLFLLKLANVYKLIKD